MDIKRILKNLTERVDNIELFDMKNKVSVNKIKINHESRSIQ